LRHAMSRWQAGDVPQMLCLFNDVVPADHEKDPADL
jgi:hypothetical protein